MAKNKTQRRRLAESIAGQRGISVKSAMRYLQRAAAPEGKQRIKNPTFSGLSPEIKRKAQKVVRKATAIRKAKVVRERGIEAIPVFPRRGKFQPGDRRTIAIKARWTFYGNDKRLRQIRFDLKGDEINNFLNAENQDRALQSLQRTKDGQFLRNVTDITEFEFFEIDGEKNDGSFWN